MTVVLAGLAVYGGYVRYVVAKGHGDGGLLVRSRASIPWFSTPRPADVVGRLGRCAAGSGRARRLDPAQLDDLTARARRQAELLEGLRARAADQVISWKVLPERYQVTTCRA